VHSWQFSASQWSPVSTQQQNSRCDGDCSNIATNFSQTDVIASPGDANAQHRSSKLPPQWLRGRCHSVDRRRAVHVRASGYDSDSLRWSRRKHKPPVDRRGCDTPGAERFTWISSERRKPQFVGTLLTPRRVCVCVCLCVCVCVSDTVRTADSVSWKLLCCKDDVLKLWVSWNFVW